MAKQVQPGGREGYANRTAGRRQQDFLRQGVPDKPPSRSAERAAQGGLPLAEERAPECAFARFTQAISISPSTAAIRSHKRVPESPTTVACIGCTEAAQIDPGRSSRCLAASPDRPGFDRVQLRLGLPESTPGLRRAIATQFPYSPFQPN